MVSEFHGSGGGTREKDEGKGTGGLNFLILSLQMKGNFGNIKIHFYTIIFRIILIKFVYKMCMYGKNVNLGVLEWQFTNFKFWDDNFTISKFWSGIKPIFPIIK